MAEEGGDDVIHVTETCPVHPEEKLKFYCTAHNELMCCYCAVKKHKPCHDTLTFAESIDRFEREKSNLFKALANQSNGIQQAVNDRRTSLDNMTSNTQEMKQSVRNLCERLRNKIMEKEYEMMKRIDSIETEHLDPIHNDVEALQCLLQSADNIKRNAEVAFLKKNQLNIITSMAKVQNTYCEIEKSAKQLLTKPIQGMEFRQSSDIGTFLDSITSLGDVIFKVEQPTPRSDVTATTSFLSVRFPSPPVIDDSDVTCTTQVPQLQVTTISTDLRSTSSSEENLNLVDHEDSDSMDEMLSRLELSNPISTALNCGQKSLFSSTDDGLEGGSLHTFLTVDHGKPCWIYGMAFMPDCRLVISDVAHDSLQLYDSSFSLICETKVSFTPWGVAAMDDNTVAVCAGGKGSLNIFSLHNNNFVHLRNLEAGIDCISLAFRNNVLIAGTRRGALLMSGEGEVMKRIEKDQSTKQFFRRADFLSTDEHRENIFITNSWAGKVVCVTAEGSQKWEFQKKGANPRGVAWNNHRLYVACRSKNAVIALDESGQERELVVAEGLECPYSIAVDHASSILTISQWDEKMTAETTRSVHFLRLS